MILGSDASISACGTYRYFLRRWWHEGGDTVLFVMLNPSTADAVQDDATIRSCIRLSKAIGYRGLMVVNLFAYRATDPGELARAADPIGPENNRVIEAAAGMCSAVICAWGAHPMAKQRAAEVVAILDKRHVKPYCLGFTKSGAPRHPLYMKTDTRIRVYS